MLRRTAKIAAVHPADAGNDMTHGSMMKAADAMVRTGTRPWLWAIPFAVALCSASAAEPLFRHCGTVLGSHPFKQLHEFYVEHPVQRRPQACYRLNDQEFLVTVSDAGRLGQGLYYLNGDEAAYDFADGAYRAGIEVERELEGPDGKRFVILETNDLHDGHWEQRYELLFSKPRENGRSFEIQKLLSLSQDPIEGMCGALMPEGVATEVRELRVAGEGTAQVSIVFVLNSQACPYGKVASYQRRFAWSAGAFMEVTSFAESAEFRPQAASGP